jgi:hypothetical protein
MLRSNLIVGICLLVTTVSWSQISDYDYQRDLESITEDWHRMVIPETMYSKVKSGLQDIRIYGLTQTRDTVEVPYLIHKNTSHLKSKSYGFKVINRSKTDLGHFFTLQLETQKPINKILLKFEDSNFDWRIKLEGSQNQQEWFSILEDYRILSIKNATTDYQFTDLNFPDANYSFFRVFIPDASQPILKSAEILELEQQSGVYTDYVIKSQRVTNNKTNKSTQIDLSLEHFVPIDRLKINVATTYDYFRNVQIQYLADSAMTEKGMKYFYRTISQNTLSSLDENQFKIQTVLAQNLRILISNNDNQPLDINSFKVSGAQQEIIARFTTPADYRLVYGNKKASRPVYDLGKFVNNHKNQLAALALGKEIKTARFEQEETINWWEQSWLLYSIMGIVILLLGGFTYQMLSNSNERSD